MVDLTRVNWQETCCAWHGQYAEQSLKSGGMARIKRDKTGAIFVIRFGADGKCIDVDPAGTPTYVAMSLAQVDAILS